MPRVDPILVARPATGAPTGPSQPDGVGVDALWNRLAVAEAALGEQPTPWAIGAYATAVQAVLAAALRQGRPSVRITAARAALARTVESLHKGTPAWEWMRACDRLRGLLIDLWW